MLEDLEAKTVPLSMNWKGGMMSNATANQTMGGREQLFVRKETLDCNRKVRAIILLLFEEENVPHINIKIMLTKNICPAQPY